MFQRNNINEMCTYKVILNGLEQQALRESSICFQNLEPGTEYNITLANIHTGFKISETFITSNGGNF